MVKGKVEVKTDEGTAVTCDNNELLFIIGATFLISDIAAERRRLTKLLPKGEMLVLAGQKKFNCKFTYFSEIAESFDY